MSDQTLQIIELLRHRHPGPEWACFAELRSGTGYGKGREQRLDFFAANTWPAKKGQSVAYEIKASRADFAREIDNPEKRRFAESVATECYFALHRGIVKPDEVPDGWGLLEVTAGGLQRVKLPTQRRIEAWPLWFMLSLARRCADPQPRLPVSAWRVAGRDLTDDELLPIAEAAFNRSLEKSREDIRHKAQVEVHASADYRELIELRQLVRSACGMALGSDPGKPADFRTWLRTRREATLAVSDLNALRAARSVIDRLIETEPKAVEPKEAHANAS